MSAPLQSSDKTVSCPKEVLDLVERFDRNLEAYKSGQYNEMQLRQEFLDPFFAALGWDMNNQQGYAEAYKDVIHEDSIKINGATKAPDYCFRIGGTRKFFLEAKKPSKKNSGISFRTIDTAKTTDKAHHWLDGRGDRNYMNR